MTRQHYHAIIFVVNMAESNVTCLQDIEEIALKSLPRNAVDYYRSGANHMSTLKENQTAFQK